MEIWKDIEGWEGIYQISDRGRLKSFKKNKRGRILSNVNKNGDYFSVILQSKNKKFPRYVRMHRLVAEAFIPNPKHKPTVNHKDGNKQNNHIWNLEWATQSENWKDAIKRNPAILEGMHYYNKFIKTNTIIQKTLNGILVAQHRNGHEASVTTGVCQRNILQVASRTEYKPGLTRSQAGGFRWEYDRN